MGQKRTWFSQGGVSKWTEFDSDLQLTEACLALASTQQRSTVMPSLLSLIGAFIALVTMATSCLAGALTDIPSADDKQKSLPAYLARPSGAGPFPAVVVLHGCNGFGSLVVGWADRLARWGYVALAIDSLTPHGATIATACAGGFLQQPVDAYQGLNFLAAQPFVRADRIAVLGASMGGRSVLTALERGLIEPMFAHKFRSGVAFYPGCEGASGLMMAPTLVLVGELDDWTPAVPCRGMVDGKSPIGAARQPGDRSMVELGIYPDAYHSFDADGLPSGYRYLGHRMQYNEAATQDAINHVHSFFERTLTSSDR